MKMLFFDIETTGLADFNKRARDPSQPHFVQFAGTLMEMPDGIIRAEYQAIAKPAGWIIPKEASDIHGITTEIARVCGTAEKEIAAKAFEMIKEADVICSFNRQFDKFIVRIALRRYDLFTDADDAQWKAKPGFCVMRAMTPICGLGKFPKLKEAYRHAFGEELKGAHNAEHDLAALIRLYFWLKEKGHLPATPQA